MNSVFLMFHFSYKSIVNNKQTEIVQDPINISQHPSKTKNRKRKKTDDSNGNLQVSLQVTIVTST